MVKRLTHRILTPTFMGSIPIAPVYVKYFAYVGSNPTRAVIPWQTKRRKLLDIENAVIGV